MDFFIAVAAVAVFFFTAIVLFDHPEKIPGHAKRKAKREAKALAGFKKFYPDITDLVVAMGYPDIRPDGWYGFNVESQEGVALLDGKKFYSSARTGPYLDAEGVIKKVFDEIAKSMESYVARVNQDKKLKQMVSGNSIIGDRRPWVED